MSTVQVYPLSSLEFRRLQLFRLLTGAVALLVGLSSAFCALLFDKFCHESVSAANLTLTSPQSGYVFINIEPLACNLLLTVNISGLTTHVYK